MSAKNSQKGSKKSRRFGKTGRPASAVAACATRKAERKRIAHSAMTTNRAAVVNGDQTPWEQAKAKRAAKRVHKQAAYKAAVAATIATAARAKGDQTSKVVTA